MHKAGIKEVSEEELIRGCVDGSEQHFHLAYDRFYGKMFNICRRYARDRDEARDMLQEGFIRIFKNIGQYKGEGSFEGWLRRVMVNSCVNFYRRYNSRLTIEYLDTIEMTASENGMGNYSGNGVSSITDKLNADALLHLVQKLPPTYRMVFNLHTVDGYSHTEIAQQLHITESTSRSNLLKARKKLMNMIQTTGYQKV
jgi:RNA polymerase sigma-70 factor (ECF subfamily)